MIYRGFEIEVFAPDYVICEDLGSFKSVDEAKEAVDDFFSEASEA